MNFRALGAALAALAMVVLLPAMAAAAEVTVYKSPYCGCCGAWVTHMKDHGHDMKTVEMEDLTAIKKMTGVPEPLQSCHTAVIDGYVIEGRIPSCPNPAPSCRVPSCPGLSLVPSSRRGRRPRP